MSAAGSLAQVLPVLHISLRSPFVSARAAGRPAGSLRQGPAFGHQDARQRRLAATHAAETTQQGAAAARGGAPAVDLSGGASGGSPPAAGRLAAALRKKQLDAALREFLRLADEGAALPEEQCNELITGEAGRARAGCRRRRR